MIGASHSQGSWTFPFQRWTAGSPIARCGNQLSTSVCRKLTHTDCYLPTHSHHHSRMLTGVMQCMHYRAHQILLFHVTIPHLFKACFSLYSSVIQLTKAYAAETSCVIESMLRPVLKSLFQLFLHVAMSLYDIMLMTI